MYAHALVSLNTHALQIPHFPFKCLSQKTTQNKKETLLLYCFWFMHFDTNMVIENAAAFKTDDQR